MFAAHGMLELGPAGIQVRGPCIKYGLSRQLWPQSPRRPAWAWSLGLSHLGCFAGAQRVYHGAPSDVVVELRCEGRAAAGGVAVAMVAMVTMATMMLIAMMG